MSRDGAHLHILTGVVLMRISVMENYRPVVHVRPPKSCVKLPIVQAIALFQEGMQHRFSGLFLLFLTHCPRYLETLESNHDRLQARVKELEARLREVEPNVNGASRPSNSQHFLGYHNAPNPQSQSSTYISPTVGSSPTQSLSPRGLPYPEERSSDTLTPNSVLHSLGGAVQGEQDANTDPGVFESGDAGKGWYLGCASGSTSFFSYSLI